MDHLIIWLSGISIGVTMLLLPRLHDRYSYKRAATRKIRINAYRPSIENDTEIIGQILPGEDTQEIKAVWLAAAERSEARANYARIHGPVINSSDHVIEMRSALELPSIISTGSWSSELAESLPTPLELEVQGAARLNDLRMTEMRELAERAKLDFELWRDRENREWDRLMVSFMDDMDHLSSHKSILEHH